VERRYGNGDIYIDAAANGIDRAISNPKQTAHLHKGDSRFTSTYKEDRGGGSKEKKRAKKLSPQHDAAVVVFSCNRICSARVHHYQADESRKK
jgi:hypothetical protein